MVDGLDSKLVGMTVGCGTGSRYIMHQDFILVLANLSLFGAYVVRRK